MQKNRTFVGSNTHTRPQVSHNTRGRIFCFLKPTTIKHKGSVSEFKMQREKELLTAYKLQLSNPQHTKVDMIFWNAVAKTPATRFWVSVDRAVEVIGKMIRGEDVHTKRRKNKEMFEHLFAAVLKEKEQNPHGKLTHLVERAIRTPAPEMFITAGVAKKIVTRIRRRMKATTLQRLSPFLL